MYFHIWYFLKNNLGGTTVPWCLCFGLLVIYALGYKARVDHSIAYFLTCVQWIYQIHLWCDIWWHLDNQRGSQATYSNRSNCLSHSGAASHLVLTNFHKWTFPFSQLTEALKKRPMQAMNPTQKAAILAFLCNELLTSKAVSTEIEGHLETVQNLRRDKWVAESKMRKWVDFYVQFILVSFFC